MTILIKKGRLINPASGTDEETDIFIEGEIVKEISKNINRKADRVIDAENLWVVPGLIDLHVHFRDPGYEYKEDILTGSRAAVAGGFTSVCLMPNTNPPVDSPETVRRILDKGKEVNLTNIYTCGSITKGMEGIELSQIEEMHRWGIAALSEDGKTVADSSLVKEAFVLCRQLDIPMMSHCEDVSLAKGVMHEGSVSESLGLPGISGDMEDIIIARDCLLAQSTGARLHICHVATARGVEIIRFAKSRGVKVTAEAAPHHFTLSHTDIDGTDANYKMNPPLRTKDDVEGIIEGLADGTIDAIATDHAPHSQEEKSEFINGANGIIGLETSLPVSMTALVHNGKLTPVQLISKMSYNPARILGIDKGDISPSKCADITIIDPNCEHIINADNFYSKGRNCPYNGLKAKGNVKYTIVGGRLLYEAPGKGC